MTNRYSPFLKKDLEIDTITQKKLVRHNTKISMKINLDGNISWGEFALNIPIFIKAVEDKLDDGYRVTICEHFEGELYVRLEKEEDDLLVEEHNKAGSYTYKTFR